MITNHNIHSNIHRNNIVVVMLFRNVSLCMRNSTFLAGRYISKDLGMREIYG